MHLTLFKFFAIPLIQYYKVLYGMKVFYKKYSQFSVANKRFRYIVRHKTILRKKIIIHKTHFIVKLPLSRITSSQPEKKFTKTSINPIPSICAWSICTCVQCFNFLCQQWSLLLQLCFGSANFEHLSMSLSI